MTQEFDSPAATQQAEPATDPPSATTRLVTWHDDLVVWVDQLGWLRAVNDWLTAALVPFRERHQDNLALELMHGGRWVGHPLHPALSDLPIGLWTGAMVLDIADRSLSFKSGRSGSKIGPYSQLRGQFAGRRQSAIAVAPIAGPINVRCEGRCDGRFDLGPWGRFARRSHKSSTTDRSKGRHPRLRPLKRTCWSDIHHGRLAAN